MFNWLRQNPIAMVGLTMMRLYLGVQWTLAGFSKLTAPGGFDPSGMIKMGIESPVLKPDGSKAFPFYDWFLNVTTQHGTNTDLFAFLVPWGELLVGLGLIFGTLTLAAAFFGLVMNFVYLQTGVVSVNPTYIMLEFLILVGGANSGKLGLDRWVMPFIQSKLPWFKTN